MAGASQSRNEPAIHARDVERRYGNVRVLRGVDLDVATGETMALLGANGAGKTTLLRVLAGLSRASYGRVEMFGQELPGDNALRASIGMVAHETFLYGDLTARENLEYYARLYGVDAAAVAGALERIALGEAVDRPVRTYSRGMQQRTALARATLHSPRVLLLDEPFTGLDQEGAAFFAETLGALAAGGVTVVMTTHDFARAASLADRAVVLSEGVVAWRSGDGALDADTLGAAYRDIAGGR